MPCKEEENALLYAYGELEESKTRAFLEHLKVCKECQNVLYLSALTTASLKPKQAPEFIMPASFAVNEKKNTFSFLRTFRGIKWEYPALVFGAFALILGFTAFDFIIKKPMVSTSLIMNSAFEEVDTSLTDLETEISDLFQYMEEL